MAKQKDNKPGMPKRSVEYDVTEVTLTINVTEPGYIPDWLNVRHQISETTFTAAVKKSDFPRLEADEMVETFSINEELDL